MQCAPFAYLGGRQVSPVPQNQIAGGELQLGGGLEVVLAIGIQGELEELARYQIIGCLDACIAGLGQPIGYAGEQIE